MRKLFPQIMRRPTFDESCNVGRQRVGIASEEEMNMIRLDRQFDDLPSVLIDDFFNDLFQTVMNWANQNLPPSFGTPDDMVDHQMDGMLFMDVFVFHVDSILLDYACCQQYHPTQAALKGRPIHPRHKWTGLSGPFSVTVGFG